ncbi:transporter substrate-binding domain-containing protein [Aureimonas fodinaquatilis]|uniref:Transporter substrate-binding domain-containing protein n=1 Tax=Aureimonas fodinaquatilis TaxID=2565783 RepID=A0A5B0DX12_9HYPH|nr:transporter substrate-binding domain-containing protein [Aureimonas fodinaquatilis]KAA0970100.1 transporter substrate-binding domain-containing protein [Aureimonas fodinaquatilis]
MLRHAFTGAFALALSFGLLAQPAHANKLEEIKERGRVIIAIDLGHPPYGMLDGSAQQTGSDVETAKLLAEDLGVALEVVAVSGANRVPFLISNRVDLVIASFSITEERKKVIDFSRPYGVIPVVISAPASIAISSPADLAGQQIAVARGTTADIEVTRLVKESGANATIVRYEDEATATTAVGTGQQSLFAAALSTAQDLAENNPRLEHEVKLEMAAYPMAIGLRKNDTELTEWVNEWVSTNLHNGKLNAIYEEYFGQSLPAEMLQ